MSEQIAKGVYRHYKGPLYMVLGSSTHCESREEIVRYICAYGDDFHEHSQERSRFEEDIYIAEVAKAGDPAKYFMSMESIDALPPDERGRITIMRKFFQPRFQHVRITAQASAATEVQSYLDFRRHH